MAVMVVWSTFVESSLGENFLYFALLYAVVRFMFALLYWNAHRANKVEFHFAKGLSLAILIGASVSLLSIFLEGVAKFVVFIWA